MPDIYVLPEYDAIFVWLVGVAIMAAVVWAVDYIKKDRRGR